MTRHPNTSVQWTFLTAGSAEPRPVVVLAPSLEAAMHKGLEQLDEGERLVLLPSGRDALGVYRPTLNASSDARLF